MSLIIISKVRKFGTSIAGCLFAIKMLEKKEEACFVCILYKEKLAWKLFTKKKRINVKIGAFNKVSMYISPSWKTNRKFV